LSLSPWGALKAIRASVLEALSRDLTRCVPELAATFELVVGYTTPVEAYRGNWYPEIEHPAPRTLGFKAADFFDIQRAIRFIV
jgi:D-amino peptidase